MEDVAAKEITKTEYVTLSPPHTPHPPSERGKVGVSLDGARVVGVLQHSPAHQAGLREGDTIRMVNGVVSGSGNVMNQIKERCREGRITINVLRGDAIIDMTIFMDGLLPLGYIDKRNSGREIAL